MLTFINEGGPFMIFQLVCILLVLGFFLRQALRLFGKAFQIQPGDETRVHAVLFWGAMALVLGFFSHYVGLFRAMEAISRANDISPGIVAKGYQMALITVLTGIGTFVVSALLWALLRWRFLTLKNR